MLNIAKLGVRLGIFNTRGKGWFVTLQELPTTTQAGAMQLGMRDAQMMQGQSTGRDQPYAALVSFVLKQKLTLLPETCPNRPPAKTAKATLGILHPLWIPLISGTAVMHSQCQSVRPKKSDAVWFPCWSTLAWICWNNQHQDVMLFFWS